MEFQENVSLKQYSTMRVGGEARYLVSVRSKDELKQAVSFAKEKSLSTLILGHGTNTLFTDKGFDGLVIVNEIMGFNVVEEDSTGVTIKIGAGEDWDGIVKRSIDLGLSGIEALTMIPGTVGAAPISNIGCYGQELSDVLDNLTAYDIKNDDFVTFSNEHCHFHYRGSRFSDTDRERFIITDITLKLHRNSMKAPFYRDIEEYFKNNGIVDYSPGNIRRALIHIRTNKLPNPKNVSTLGSFFKNPIVTRDKFNQILKQVPEIDYAKPQWSQAPRWFLDDGTVKIAAARLIELAGFDGYYDLETGMALWPTQNLTLVNKSAKSANDVLTFRNKIVDAVREKFDIKLEEEVRVIE